jgi:dTMP kinase
MRGLFVTFEGIDRSGKTTQAKLLLDALGDQALGVREPGGTEAGERVRAILKDPDVPLAPQSEALLFAAARSELVEEVILPALAENRVVVSDRFLDSSLAYQGGARGLGVEEVERVNRFATRGLRPDLTFLLDLSPEAAAERAGESDRFEDEGASLQQAVAAAYEHLIEADPERWRRLDASRPPEAVHADVLAEVGRMRG